MKSYLVTSDPNTEWYNVEAKSPAEAVKFFMDGCELRTDTLYYVVKADKPRVFCVEPKEVEK